MTDEESTADQIYDELMTGPLTIRQLCARLGLPYDCIRSSIRRMEGQYVCRAGHRPPEIGKRGRRFIVYAVMKTHAQEITDAEMYLGRSQ